ncbi:MAG: hypothetical protein JKX92_12255 [Porticoccaceae bacterium]|nr:hypothetical protein [Porticoccaceae bacterium]
MKHSKTTDIATLISSPGLPTLQELQVLPATEQMQNIAKAQQITTAGQVYCGRALAALKASVDHGEYLQLLEGHGWHQRTARRYTKFAEFAVLVEKTNGTALSALEMSSWLLLEKELDEPSLIEFIDGKEVCGLTLEEAQNKSVREIKAAFVEHQHSTNTEILQLQKVNADLALEKDTQANQINTLKAQLEQRNQQTLYPDFVMSTRHEAGAMGDKAMLCLDDLEKLNSNLHDTARSANGDDVNVALISLYTHINAVLARTQRLASDMRSRWGDAVGDASVKGSMFYSDAEIDDLMRARELLVRDHEQEKKFRANERDANKPRGRGRPRKQD